MGLSESYLESLVRGAVLTLSNQYVAPGVENDDSHEIARHFAGARSYGGDDAPPGFKAERQDAGLILMFLWVAQRRLQDRFGIAAGLDSSAIPNCSMNCGLDRVSVTYS